MSNKNVQVSDAFEGPSARWPLIADGSCMPSTSTFEMPEVNLVASEVEVSTSEIELPTSEMEVTSSEMEVTSSETDVTTSETDVSTSETDVTTSETDVTTSEMDVISPEMDVISSEMDVSTSETDVTTSETDVTTSETDVLSPEEEPVPFDINCKDYMDEGEPYLKLGSHKRKKIFRRTPEGSVVIGEISFIVQVEGNRIIETEGAQASLLICNLENEIDLIIEVTSKKVCKDYAVIKSLNDFPWKAINDLLSRNFIWIIEDLEGCNRGIITIKIAFLLEKEPIEKVKHVMELFAVRVMPSFEEDPGVNVDSIENFLKEMQEYQKQNLCFQDVDVQHEKLKPTLCPYQARAVQWMLGRESPVLLTQTPDWLSHLLEAFVSFCNTNMYYNIHSQSLYTGVLHFPEFPRGGILADEMGLGKTVAVIALILNHPRSMENETDTDKFLIPIPQKNVNKSSRIKSKDIDSTSSIKSKNMEGCLSPKEELVASNARKGTAMKRALNEWYESTLAEYSASSRSKVPRTSKSLIKCVCGDSFQQKRDLFVECNDCKRLQHSDCVGYAKEYPYYCPLCWSKQKLVKSDATLIISPPNIYQQWLEEIKKHVGDGAFRKGVFMYDDIKTNFIQPFVLASYDIVICTYSRLRAELHHALKIESPRKLRNEERFLRQCSPLTQINWWRLCLDEAQMVEADSSAISQMAKLIPAVNRWSVTGTPMQKSINDIYHLLDFLRIEPFTDRYYWNTLLYLPYKHGEKRPMCSTVSQIFWRNSKEDVSAELFIPEQKVRYHFLKFTAVEQNFYMREHNTSSSEFAECLRRSKLNIKTTLNSLDKSTLTRLLNPLLNLRQACSHPLAVRGNKISTKTGSMTMTDLFKYLHNKTKVECEEELRKFVAALNGMAGIYCILEKWSKAVHFYRRVLQINEEFKANVNVDALQRIHTMTNLAQVLESHGQNIAPTIRDERLRDDAKQLEDKYMEKILQDFRSDQRLMAELSAKVREMEQELNSRSEIWWAHLINTLMANDAIEEVIDKVSSELLSNQTENRKNIEVFLSKISSPKLIEVLVRNWLLSVKTQRRGVMSILKSLIDTSPDKLVSEAVDCHLRSTCVRRTPCALCACETRLLDYECCLFAVSRKVLKEEYEKVMDGAITKGSWKAHRAERVLRVILNVAKNKPNTENWALIDGKNHMNLLEAMKKEFKQLRVMWMNLSHQVQARDEVNMCKVRLRLRQPGEPLPPKPPKLNLKEQSRVETIYIIQHHEVEAQRLKLAGEIEVAKSEFRKKYGTLLYLGNVGKKENAKPEPCPVCKMVLENEWCVLQCGHSYCIDCIRILLIRNTKPSINCPVCREATRGTDLSFIDLSGRKVNPDIKVVGEHSTKVEAVVRTVLELKQTDENVKVLIFSTWAVVLKVLARALEENGISFRRMPGHNYQTHLKEFKDPKLNITALLLPISWGSKGLNLIEATHVFLVEPIMNPAEELQAIGRVHRIGQRKETVVHRFLIKGTIEEKIYSAVSEAKDKWDKKKVTLEDLKNLFDIKIQSLVRSNEQNVN